MIEKKSACRWKASNTKKLEWLGEKEVLKLSKQLKVHFARFEEDAPSLFIRMERKWVGEGRVLGKNQIGELQEVGGRKIKWSSKT